MLLLITVLILALSFGVASAATIVLQVGQPSMTVDGMMEAIDPGQNTVPVIIADRTFVPIRAIVEALGGTVGWTPAEQKVTIQLDNTSIELWIGQQTAKINGMDKMLETIPFVSATNRTMLPLRFVIENLDGLVAWDDADQRITISRGEAMPNVYTFNLAEQGVSAQSIAKGQAIFKVSADGNSVSYTLTVVDLDNVTMAHIHIAPTAGGNGPPAIWLYPSAPPPVLIPGRSQGILATGTFTSANFIGPLAGMQVSDLIAAIKDGRAYVNVHTSAFPDGEIRGVVNATPMDNSPLNVPAVNPGPSGY